MMTGFGYDAQSVQPILSGMEEECCNRSRFFPGMRVPNQGQYGLMGDCYPPTQCSTNITSAAPRVSISDEELYRALNIEPVGTNTSTFDPSSDFLTEMPSIDTAHMPVSSNDFCYPSTSTFEENLMFDPAMYLPPDVVSIVPSPAREIASPTFSINSFAPTASTANAEEEDLEVELINNVKNELNCLDDINIFLHSGTSDNEFRSSKDTTFSESSSKAPTPSVRPAYAKKLTAAGQKASLEAAALKEIQPVSKTSPLFLQTTQTSTAGFTPLLTPKSDAILQRKLSEVTQFVPAHQPTATRRESYPTSATFQTIPFTYSQIQQQQPPQAQQSSPYAKFNQQIIDQANSLIDDSVFSAPPLGFDSYQQFFPPTVYPVAQPLHPPVQPNIFQRSIPEEEQQDSNLDDQSEEIAKGVIEKLFLGPGYTSTKKAEVVTKPKKNIQSSAARKLIFSEPTTETTMQPLEKVETPKNEVLDDWETADDDDLTERMENLLKDVKKEEKKSQKQYQMPASSSHTPPLNRSNWDVNFLPNVIEIYGIPDYKMEGDVVKALEMIGYGDCTVKWIERKIVLAVFENAKRAKSCLALSKHDWLRVRPLKDSPQNVQEKAKNLSTNIGASKKRGATNASVARRMVENVLGMKANIPTEKRREERQQIADAKAAKKNTVKWD